MNENNENHASDDNLGSCGSVDEAQTPDDDTESLNQSMSSPGGLSGLSSLQSPSTSLASPINLLASPSTPSMNHHHEENGLVASLVSQLQRNKWPQEGGSGKSKDETSKAVQIKTEPMDQSNGSYQRPTMPFDPTAFLYDKLPIIHRNPVGANPRDVNNPLSVNQLTKRDFPPGIGGGGSGGNYYPFQKPGLMTHPALAHPAAHHSFAAQFHAANFANLQLAAAAAAQNHHSSSSMSAHHQLHHHHLNHHHLNHKEGSNGASNGAPHRDDTGNAISVT